MSEIKVGQIINEPVVSRDAIHVAVASVIAEEEMRVGAHIGFYPNGKVGEKATSFMGIVDPFLLDSVKSGQRFWVFLYPKTVQNLRHDWSHPAFDNDWGRFLGISAAPFQFESKKWLEQYAVNHRITYDDLMKGVEEWLAQNEHPEDRDATLENHHNEWETPPEFWQHYKNVTGKDGSGSFWGCCV